MTLATSLLSLAEDASARTTGPNGKEALDRLDQLSGRPLRTASPTGIAVFPAASSVGR